MALSNRFWAKVNKRGPEECWPWIGGKSERGYGRIYVDGRNVPATRVSWAIHFNEAIPMGLQACHHCDNPPCVNPSHLFIGTMSDNINDAVQKGRHRGRPPRWQALLVRCRRGHDFSQDGRGRRVCLVCKKQRDNTYQLTRIARVRKSDLQRERRKAAAAALKATP